jgi:dolichol-phosphate mannosyltransferase
MANERATAVEFVDAVLGECGGFDSVRFFAVLDHACTDGTVDVLREHAETVGELEVVWAPENTCVVDGYTNGYKAALEAGCDWILEIDAGFSHQPSEMPRFIEKMAEGYDCVFGSRFCAGGRFSDAPLGRYIISRWGSVVANILLGTKLKDMTSGFEMFTEASLREVLDKGIRSRGHFFQTEIKFHCRNMHIVEVPISYRSPSHTVNSAVLLDAFKNLLYLVRQRFAG